MYRHATNLTDLNFNPRRTLSVCCKSLAVLGLSLALLSPATAQDQSYLPPTSLRQAFIPPLKEIELPIDEKSGVESNIELAPVLGYDLLDKQRDELLYYKDSSSDPSGDIVKNVNYFSRNYPWSWSAGDRSYFQVSLNANLNVIAASDNLQASAEGRADGAVLSRGFNIARAYANASSNGGNLNANFTFQVLGNYLINWNATQPVSWNWSQSWQKEVAAPYSIWLGPIPVSGRIGIRGGIGCSLSLGLYGATVRGVVTPNVNTAGFAEAGVDIGFASAGVGGSLTFLSCSFPNEAGVYLQFDASGRPQIVTYAKSHVDMNTLSGNFYVWAQLFGARRTWTLWNWAGVQWGGDLFNDTHIINL
jgi:hypothetical protein